MTAEEFRYFLTCSHIRGADKLLVSEQERKEDGKEIYRSGGGYILVYQSGRTGWYFIQRMEGIHLDVETPRLVKALATYGLLALVLLALAAVYLIWRIYRPFRALLDSLVSQKNPGYALADRASLPPNRSCCAASWQGTGSRTRDCGISCSRWEPH